MLKKYEYLALKSHEFLTMIDAISRERTTLKVKKKTEEQITVTCQIAIPVARITFKVEEQGENLDVYRTINWLPLFYSTIPFLLVLEAIIIGISFAIDSHYYFSYILIALGWVVAIIFIVYQIFTELETLTKKLYRIEV